APGRAGGAAAAGLRSAHRGRRTDRAVGRVGRKPAGSARTAGGHILEGAVERSRQDRLVIRKIVINADAYETRVAILEEDELVELLVERADQRRHVGDIYKGRVNAVLPGMQAAFVDLGLPKIGFLHASDLAENLAGMDDLSDIEESDNRRRKRAPVLKIEDHLKKGQEVLVQITKESIGTKC